MRLHKHHNTLKVIYFTGFLIAINNAFLAYINSSFLSLFVDEKFVGMIFTAGAIFSVFVLAKVPTILDKFGNFKTTLFVLALEMVALSGLAVIKAPILAILAFILHYGFQMLLMLNADVYLEHFSNDKCTGGIRGTFLTIQNTAWMISPFIVGSILNNSDYWKIYLISAAILIPAFLAILSNLKGVQEVKYDHPPFWQTLKGLWKNKNIYKIFMINFFLQFFFAWMVIYTPIYLHQHLGFDWKQIGIIFTIMLAPYVLFEFPLGKIADKWLGEKEILSAGFIVTGLTTGAMTFITSTNIAVWATILFGTRVGGSFIQIMCESYFFKQVDDSDVNIIGFYRNARPLAYIISPVVGTLFLSFFPYKYIFLALGLITLLGLRYSLTLKDTK